VSDALRFPFDRSGYRHVLLARWGPWCIVERTWIEDGRPHLPHYEIVRVQHSRPRTWPDGRQTPAHEAYPKPSQWGREAWTVPTLTHARDFCAQLRVRGVPLPPWAAFGLAEDKEGYQAWKEGRLPRRHAPAPNKGIVEGPPAGAE